MLGLFFRDDFAGVYSVCDGPALSHGPYLGTVTLCSFLSIVLLSVKACLFTVNSHIEAEASVSFRKQRLHLKKPWGMPVLFLSSVVFALGHTVVAYRTSCRARRKLLFHRVDPEAVSLKFLSSFLFIWFHLFVLLLILNQTIVILQTFIKENWGTQLKFHICFLCYFFLSKMEIHLDNLYHSFMLTFIESIFTRKWHQNHLIKQVLSCKNVFSGYPKVPRSPTPSVGRTPKSDYETRRRPFGTARDEELLVRLLANSDSSFITCQGLTLHYKLSLPGSPPHSLSSMSCIESNSSRITSAMAAGFAKPNKHFLSASPNIQPQLYRSYSNQFHGPSLHVPLLDGPINSSISEDIPVFHLDGVCEDETNILDYQSMEKNSKNVGQLGLVLIHGFGGGVFSWRHMMGSLARQSNCSVAAFDRPGWGLSSRPRREDWEEKELPNPYKLETQVSNICHLCKLS